MSLANARVSPLGGLLMVQRTQGGILQAHGAALVGQSLFTAAKWWNRWQARQATVAIAGIIGRGQSEDIDDGT